MEAEHKESRKKVYETHKANELEKYWQVVRDNPSDFAGWTYLLHYIEQENDIKAAREAFVAFFQHYPYCYGYWKKFADMEKNVKNLEAAEKVFEEGTKAIPLSVDLWIHYINFYKSQYADKENSYENIKALFYRALDAAGCEFRSDRLWDLYVNWEENNKNLKEVTAAYDRLFTIPTQLYSHHFEKFRKHVKKHSPREILSTDEFLELRQNVVKSLNNTEVGDEDEDKGEKADSLPPGSEVPPGMDTNPEKDMMSSEEVDLMKKKIVEKRKALHEKNEIEVGKRWTFEEGIKRPYFHVKPLERAQLKNWKDYLDFEVTNGIHASIVTLFERCMIACALYEDMWLKYAKYMESQDPDGAAEVYQRACHIHLPRKPGIHFSWSSFEEQRGNVDKASEILNNLSLVVTDMLEITLRKINLERRRGNDEAVDTLYQKCIAEAKNLAMASHFSSKYARYQYKIKKDFEKAAETIKEALKKDPMSPCLLMQLVDIGYQKEPIDIPAIVQAFDFAFTTDMSNDQKLLFAQRKLEFLEDFASDPQCIQEAYDNYAKMFKFHYCGKKRGNEDSESDGKEKRTKTEVNGAVIAAPTTVTAETMQAAAQADAYQYQASQWAGYAQNYQQAWGSYASGNYYSS